MSNSYNINQQWNQNQVNFGALQLEQEFEFGSLSPPNNDRQQQMLQAQQSYGSPNLFQYPQHQQQQQQPQQHPNQTLNPHSSSLHGAFSAPHDQQPSHSRSSSFGTAQSGQNSLTNGYGQYGPQTDSPAPNNPPTLPYRSTNANFTFSPPSSLPLALQNMDIGQRSNPNFLTSSPGPLNESFPTPSTSAHHQQQPSYYNSIDELSPPQTKRQRGSAFKDEPLAEDGDAELNQSEVKDKQSKLARACARCKNLKVRCEAKTETEPCKRCFNGGHECVIPGRKIRRTPPKREHLLNQIQSQAKEIERLMHELEKVSVSSSKHPRNLGQLDITSLPTPVLSPSTTQGPFFGSEAQPIGGGEDTSYNATAESSSSNNAAMNKAVEEWLSKARESLHDFGSFIGIGGAGMPKSYLVEEDYEDDYDEDDDYLEDEAESFGNSDDQYEVAVENPNGEGAAQIEQGAKLNHKSSNSSIGTVGTAGTNTQPRKKNSGENAKPANLPVGASPFGLFGELSLKNPPSRSASAEPEEEDKGPGIANANFFKSTSAPHALGRRLEAAQHQAPSILTRGIISPQEAERLFKIYFDNMNLSVSLLDPVLYTAQRTFYRSPFLFTVICAIASRFYLERPDLYAKCMHYAQLAAGTALISGNKNVEMCSAYILLSLYPVPVKKWEDQRSWLYLGLAIRVATDINLHIPTSAKPLNENHAREMLNRTRVWLNCFNVDRSTGSQYGKPPIINSADYLANHSTDWWSMSPHNMRNFDIHISAYNAELRVMGKFMSKIYSDPHHPTGLNKSVDFEKIAVETDDELQALRAQWFARIQDPNTTDQDDPQNRFRTGLLKLAYSYSRLIALSYGFQHAFGKTDGIDENPFLIRCFQAARDVVNALVYDIHQPGQLHFLRHGPEAQSVFVTFASAFLVKLLQPRFASYLNADDRAEIRGLVQKVIDILGSPEVSIDDRHGPRLYSRFLEKLLAKPMARLDPLSPGSASNVPLPRQKSQPRQFKTSPTQTPDSQYATFEIPTTVYTHPSPTSSLSPPPTESALSFDNFAPLGPIDPYVPETVLSSVNATAEDNNNVGNAMMTEFFRPSLPFDDQIMQSMQSLTDPSGWRDFSMPVGFNWMTQFQENLGLDLPAMAYDQNMDYMTGPTNNNH